MGVYYRTGNAWERLMSLPTRLYPNLVTCYKIMVDVSWASRQQPVTGQITLRRRDRYFNIEITLPARLLDPKIGIMITPTADAEADSYDDPV